MTKPDRDLNKLRIRTDGNEDDGLEDFACKVMHAQVEVVFRNVGQRLTREIAECDYVFGCVAWLTHPQILAALAHRKGVALIVQKEDFLRPDSDDGGRSISAPLKEAYGRLRGLSRGQFKKLCGMSYAGDTRIDPVRCVGNANVTKSIAHPRAHHKFVVFANARDCRGCEQCEHVGDDGEIEVDIPAEHDWDIKSVWTGSYNFTANSSNSLENAVIIHSRPIAYAYYREFLQVAALSEPLDWETPWCEPEWRIGS